MLELLHRYILLNIIIPHGNEYALKFIIANFRSLPAYLYFLLNNWCTIYYKQKTLKNINFKSAFYKLKLLFAVSLKDFADRIKVI